MARKSNTRAPSGAGSIRRRADGRWEARYTYSDALGNKKRGSLYAATQRECREKLTAAVKKIDDGVFIKPQRCTLSQWLDRWVSTYCVSLKPATLTGYRSKIENRIKPYIGATQLAALNNVQLQSYYNLLAEGSETVAPLSPKSIRNIHAILHKALNQAVVIRLLHENPADHIILPRLQRPTLTPLMDQDVARFMAAIRGDKFERLFLVALFSGLRQSELVGLTWEDVDFDGGTLSVRHQLQKDAGCYRFMDETKNGKCRTAVIAPSIVKVLLDQKEEQTKWAEAAGSAWNNTHSLVFTDKNGNHLKHRTIDNHFKAAVKSIGMEHTRFHDLRHSYAINALQAGDNYKSVQEQLGHSSASFTLSTYAAVSNTMRKQSQMCMERVFQESRKETGK